MWDWPLSQDSRGDHLIEPTFLDARRMSSAHYSTALRTYKFGRDDIDKKLNKNIIKAAQT